MYQVTVGNIGTVLATNEYSAALREFNHYVAQSKAGIGRGADRQVIVWQYGGPLLSYYGPEIEEE